MTLVRMLMCADTAFESYTLRLNNAILGRVKTWLFSKNFSLDLVAELLCSIIFAYETPRQRSDAKRRAMNES